MLMSEVFAGIGCVALADAGVRLAVCIKTTGKAYPRSILRTIGLSVRGPILLAVLSGLMLIICTLVGQFSKRTPSDGPSSYESLFYFGVAAYVLTRVWSPPAILFLSASRRRGLALSKKLSFLAAPFKVTHLLLDQTPPVSLLGRAVLGSVFGLDQYRVFRKWQAAVYELSHMAPIIVIDARTPSPALKEELIHNIKAGLVDRTFILYDAHGMITNGIVPALQDTDYPFSSDARLVAEHQFLEAISGMGYRWLITFRVDPVSFLEKRILKVRKSWGELKDVSGKCENCGKRLFPIASWSDEITPEQRLDLDSYDVPSIFQCRACGLRLCEKCAIESNLRCVECRTLNLRIGYPTIRRSPM